MSHKDMKKLTREVRRRGWEVIQRRSGHLTLKSPSGEKVFCAATPSDQRAIRNIKKDLAHHGLDLSE